MNTQTSTTVNKEISSYEQQAIDFADKYGIKMKIISSKYGLYFADDKICRYIFKCKLSMSGKSYTFNFGQSIAECSKEPSLYSVFACLEKNDPEDFEFFCSNYGYDTDSRSAYKTFKGVERQYNSMLRVFGSDILEEMQDIN